MTQHFRIFSRVLATAFAITVLIILPVSAQVTTGDITGRVTDPQGKVVAGATVTATNKATSAARNATSNDSGDYTIAQLPPGKYEVTAEAQGFSKSLLPDFELNVGAKPTL